MEEAPASKVLDPSRLTGETIAGRYEVLEELGRGGNSVVYRCREAMLSRFAALKTFDLRYTDDKNFKRFQKEVKVLSELSHPNIVRIYSTGIDDRIGYIAMELLGGETLDKILRKGPLAYQQFQAIFVPILEALAHCHEKGLIHRDLKPSNIMVPGIDDTMSSGAKLFDFGLAQRVELDPDTGKRTINYAGTPTYMSPEQCAGNELDYRSDIYSLACVMYESISGVAPFAGDNPLQVQYSHIKDPAPEFDLRSKHIPAAIKQEIMKALSKNPADRPSLAEFQDVLSTPAEEVLVTNRPGAPLKIVLIGLVALALVFCCFAFVSTTKNVEKTLQKESVLQSKKLSSLDEQLREANSLEQAKQYKEAAALYRKVVERAPASRNEDIVRPALFGAGNCYMKLGDLENATYMHKKEIEFSEPFTRVQADSVVRLCADYYSMGKLDTGMSLCKKYMDELERNRGKLLDKSVDFNLGILYSCHASGLVNKERYKEGIIELKKAISFFKNVGNEKLTLEEIYPGAELYEILKRQKADTSPATTYLFSLKEKAFSEQNSTAVTRVNLYAGAMEKLGFYDKAIEAYKQGFESLKWAPPSTKDLMKNELSDGITRCEAKKREQKERR